MINTIEIETAIQYFQAGKIKESKELLNVYLSTYPDDVNANLLSAAICAQEGDFSGVVKQCEKILKADPGNVNAAFNAAVASDKLKMYKDVLMFSSIVISNDKTNETIGLLRLTAKYELDELNDFIHECIQLIFLHEGQVVIVSTIYKYLIGKGDSLTLVKIFKNVLKRNMVNMEVLYHCVLHEIYRDDFEKAHKFLKRIKSNNKMHLCSINAEISLLFSQRMFDDCIKFITSSSDQQIIHSPDVVKKLAECYTSTGEYDRALILFKKLIDEKFYIAECFHNIGLIEGQRENLKESLQAYQAAVNVAPGVIFSIYNLAFVLDKLGRKKDALNAINRCYEISPDANVKQAYVQILSSAKVEHLTEYSEQFLLKILVDNDIDAQTLSNIVINYLEERYNIIRKLLKSAVIGNFDGFLKIFESNLDELVSIDLLPLLYSNLPISRYDFECLTKMLRHALLLRYDNNSILSDPLINLSASIAVRCYINGYLFTVEDTEFTKIGVLKKAFNIDSGIKLNEADVAIVAMYISLYTLHNNNKFYIDTSLFSKNLKYLIKLQLDDNLIEEKSYPIIESPSEISDKTSLLVQQQYEGNPYPVWQRLSVNKPELIHEVLRKISPTFYNFSSLAKNPEILIAGCGTGSHVIQTAMRISHKSITALDLSKKSLAFAIRKTNEYKLNSIMFKQLDILNVRCLDRRFDVIESVGVVHHMKNPLEGLAALVNVLKSDGVINLGFYSKLGRRFILDAKRKYDEHDVYVTDDEIRKKRVELMESDEEELVKNIISYKDFYSLHDCRDLIFHENENNYSIAELSKLLNDSGLEFIGFDLYDASVLSGFKKMFPNNSSQFILENWGVYEEKNPDIFSCMYVFWCKKNSALLA